MDHPVTPLLVSALDRRDPLDMAVIALEHDRPTVMTEGTAVLGELPVLLRAAELMAYDGPDRDDANLLTHVACRRIADELSARLEATPPAQRAGSDCGGQPLSV